MLPESVRIVKAKTVLGPNGSWWLKDRVVGVVDVLPGHRIKAAVPHGSGVRLMLEGSRQSQADFDHVIAGTGYRVDLARLPFLPEQLRTAIKSSTAIPWSTGTARRPCPDCASRRAHRACSSVLPPGSSRARTR